MMKKDYVCPDAKVVKIDSHCMLGNESGIGEGISRRHQRLLKSSFISQKTLNRLIKRAEFLKILSFFCCFLKKLLLLQNIMTW